MGGVLNLEVHTESYRSLFQIVGPGLLRQDRTHRFDERVRLLDVFSNLWGWGVGEFPKGTVYINRRGKLQEISGCKLMVAPPFSVIDWSLGPGLIGWTGYFTYDPFPSQLPGEVAFADWSGRPAPATITALANAARSVQHWHPAGKGDFPSAVAERTKRHIDQNFKQELSVTRMATELRFSHAVMTRMFTRNYGISPVAYRNRLRVFESLGLLLLQGWDIGSVCRAVGFSSVSRFDKHFRNFSKTIPSNFRLR